MLKSIYDEVFRGALCHESTAQGIEISVEDTGRGIAAENLDKVFEKSFTFGKPNGTGLGLAYCKQVVEAHGGSIEVQSKVGEGTTFTVRIPGCVVHEESVAGFGGDETSALPQSEPALEVNHADAKAIGNVLISDDDSSIRLQWMKIVSKLGGTVVCAIDSPEELMGRKGFDFSAVNTAVVDYQYHGSEKTGVDLIGFLRQNGVQRIYLCTGLHEDADIRRRAHEAGAIAVIPKPIDEQAVAKSFC